MLSKKSLQIILELLNKVSLSALDPQLSQKTEAFIELKKELEAAFKAVTKEKLPIENKLKKGKNSA